MSIKKSIFKIFNGTSWDEYYHKTSADQVVYTKTDGTASNVQAELAAQNSAYITKDINVTVKVPASQISYTSRKIDIPSGYIPVGVLVNTYSYIDVITTVVTLDDTGELRINCNSAYQSETTVTIYLRILFKSQV